MDSWYSAPSLREATRARKDRRTAHRGYGHPRAGKPPPNADTGLQHLWRQKRTPQHTPQESYVLNRQKDPDRPCPTILTLDPHTTRYYISCRRWPRQCAEWRPSKYRSSVMNHQRTMSVTDQEASRASSHTRYTDPTTYEAYCKFDSSAKSQHVAVMVKRKFRSLVEFVAEAEKLFQNHH